jgi:hypothetical protein
LRNSNGYIYVELLVAFFVLTFLIATIFPMLQEIEIDRKNNKIRSEAVHLLYEQLNGVTFEENVVVEVGITLYTIHFANSTEFPSMIEGCINYKIMEGSDENICDLTKR